MCTHSSLPVTAFHQKGSGGGFLFHASPMGFGSALNPSRGILYGSFVNGGARTGAAKATKTKNAIRTVPMTAAGVLNSPCMTR